MNNNYYEDDEGNEVVEAEYQEIENHRLKNCLWLLLILIGSIVGIGYLITLGPYGQ